MSTQEWIPPQHPAPSVLDPWGRPSGVHLDLMQLKLASTDPQLQAAIANVRTDHADQVNETGT